MLPGTHRYHGSLVTVAEQRSNEVCSWLLLHSHGNVLRRGFRDHVYGAVLSTSCSSKEMPGVVVPTECANLPADPPKVSQGPTTGTINPNLGDPKHCPRRPRDGFQRTPQSHIANRCEKHILPLTQLDEGHVGSCD